MHEEVRVGAAGRAVEEWVWLGVQGVVEQGSVHCRLAAQQATSVMGCSQVRKECCGDAVVCLGCSCSARHDVQC
jgi:hypothetical protein